MVWVNILIGCSVSGGYTGVTTYGGGDSDGVTVYKTSYNVQGEVDDEATLHCQKFKKVARRLSCSSIWGNNCIYACDDLAGTQNIQLKKTEPPSSPKPLTIHGSGFFVSNLGHVVTSAHIIKGCKNISAGGNSKNQITVQLISTDNRSDLALLKFKSPDMASQSSKSFIQKLGIKVGPLTSNGLLRAVDVKLGEEVLVAGYPFGALFSDTLKVTSGIVSATRGAGDNSGQFQLDAAVQIGNSGGPIYDRSGSIVGVVMSQLKSLKVGKAVGTYPENMHFGIKASTVNSFLVSNGLPLRPAHKLTEKSTSTAISPERSMASSEFSRRFTKTRFICSRSSGRSGAFGS